MVVYAWLSLTIIFITVDNNECTDGTHNCHKDANCEDNVGNFSCRCKSGYIGDGVSSCSSMFLKF